MFRQLQRAVPMLKSAVRCPQPAATQRTLFDWPRSTDMRSLFRDMEREMARMERELFGGHRRSPFLNLLPRFIPIEGAEGNANTYRVNLDVRGFNPEELNIAVKDKMLSIRAKMERSSEDGSKYFQEVHREFTLPDNVDLTGLKSFLNQDGVLTIEAPCKGEGKPKELPIHKETPQIKA